ncbi:MAG: hypothetical protein AAFQ98_01965 [Bacteroidota bacterium]
MKLNLQCYPLLGIISLVLATGCSPYALQTARTTPQGEFSVGLEGTSWIDTYPFWFGGSDPAELSNGFPQLGVVARYGITDNFDVGLHAGAFSFPHVDVKYRYAGTNDSEWARSLGAVLGFGGDIGAYANHLISYHPKDNLAFYNSIQAGYAPSIEDFVQGTVGLRYGREWGFFVEAGTIVRPRNENVLFNYGVGLSVNLSAFK